jgi:AcrR family transcriptional regulator
MTEEKNKRMELIKEERRKLYLEAAAKTFQERGFHNTAVKDITEAAGTSVGNFYHYFDSKEQVFEVLIEDFHKFLYEKLHELDKFDIPPLPIAQQVMMNMLELLKSKKEITFIYLEQIGGISKEFQELRMKLQERYILELEKIFTRGFKLVNITDQNPRVCAIGWIATFLQTYQWWATTNFEMKMEDLATYLANFLLFGTVQKTRIYPKA